ncbi:MAG: mitochondrial peripheral inner membrane protein [Sclerophora amabilis]|nr:MAG: mitochondrial peripheral inner membrane protein [Sclerophora amabilis]
MLSRRCSPHTPHLLRNTSCLPSNFRSQKVRRELNSASSKDYRPRPRNVAIFLFLGLVPTSYILSQWIFTDRAAIVSPKHFTSFTLQSRTAVSSTSSIYTLVPAANSSKTAEIPWPKDSLTWSVQIKQPELNIARSYTPLPSQPSQQATPSNSAGLDALRLLIRYNPGGELSTYLSRLPLGASVSLRGPHSEFVAPDKDDVGEVLFLAGGTGIAPAMQVAYSLFLRSVDRGESQGDSGIDKSKQLESGEEHKEVQEGIVRDPGAPAEGVQPKLRILWAVRSSQECLGGSVPGSPGAHTLSESVKSWLGLSSPKDHQDQEDDVDVTKGPIVQEINSLRATYPPLHVDYFPDDQKPSITPSVLRECLHRGVNSPASQMKPMQPARTEEKRKRRNLLLISGPDGFVNHFAGPPPSGVSGSQSRQTQIRGLLRQVLSPQGEDADGRTWEVYRL